MNKVKKLFFTKNTPKEESTQAFTFGIDGDKCTCEIEVIVFWDSQSPN